MSMAKANQGMFSNFFLSHDLGPITLSWAGGGGLIKNEDEKDKLINRIKFID